jgi:hypothetical protein
VLLQRQTVSKLWAVSLLAWVFQFLVLAT